MKNMLLLVMFCVAFFGSTGEAKSLFETYAESPSIESN